MSDLTFLEFASTVLEHRSEDGIRGIESELNRFHLHIAPAAFAPKLLTEVAPVDIRDWLRVMSLKKAADSRGDRTICTDTVKRSFALVSSIFTAACEREALDAVRTHLGELRAGPCATESFTLETTAIGPEFGVVTAGPANKGEPLQFRLSPGDAAEFIAQCEEADRRTSEAQICTTCEAVRNLLGVTK